MKRKNPDQFGFDFGEEDGSVSSSVNLDSVCDNRVSSRNSTIVFTNGADCAVPTVFPTIGTMKTHDIFEILRQVEEARWWVLKKLKARWFCWSCNQWHEFSERFFKEFQGRYPHQWS